MNTECNETPPDSCTLLDTRTITFKQNRKKETVITIAGMVDADAVERATRYLRYLELTGCSKSGTQAQLDELARSVKRGMAYYNSYSNTAISSFTRSKS